MVRAAFLLIAIFASVLAGCQKGAEGPSEIVIGVAGPMTGDQSKLGGDVERGARLAVEEWNARGGINGKKLRLEVGDDQHDPKQAVSVANKLVNSGIVGMVGHFNSSASIPASAVYNSAGVPMITPASTNPRLTDQGFWNVFRVCGRDDQQGKVAADFVGGQLKLKRVAILHDKTTYGQGLAEEFRKSLAAYPESEVVSFDGITQGDKDFRGILTSIKGKNPELFFFGGVFPEGGQLAKQAKEVGLTAPMLSGDGVIDPKFIEIAGAAAEGTYLTFTPDPENMPEAKGFLEKYKAKHGNELAPYAIYSYDAANILLTALAEAEKEGKIKDGKRVAEIMRNVNYDGALGHIEFDEKGDVKKSPYIVWITKNGKFEEFWKPQG
ncbi:MAG: branched-chain amino acid ABC transporter substrate-binding protein [Candidatus Manganitrophus sp.]|nr:branched-chain amino acid ABC transporter substrate-binding protein [Candidatus Manganitrophus sp.]MDC4223099.1 branched-chain amino acid ABC transporter substrate-binding protein [Candidatus Manganitrophus sp.]WDT69999.1 MAG: branched-chain amino acid ABC transporter substrate-binding protein [Candidatus Manganitrophus sp.]